MKLFDYYHCYDYGHEWYLNLLSSEKLNVFQFNLDWSEYAREIKRSGIIINIGSESLFGFSFFIGKFSFCFDFLCYQPRDLQEYTHYRN